MVFLGVAYTISWTCWIAAWLLAQRAAGGEQFFNADLVDALFFDPAATTTAVGLSLVSLIGVYGPALAGVLATRIDPAVSLAGLSTRVRRVRLGARWYGQVAGILALVTVPAIVVTSLTSDSAADAPSGGRLLFFVAVFFVFQLLTSATEEIGWRGYLTERLRHGRDFWDTGWAVGIPWAVWHVPVVVFIFVGQGMGPVQLVGNLVGFGAGIVAAAILHAWFYERTRSVALNMLIHAAFNTVPLATVLLFEGSSAAVISQIALWVVVIALRRRQDRDVVGPSAGSGTDRLARREAS